MQNLRRKNESGRSMVEMLGILAIIGVLSAGGVYGYGVAMKKHKANELLYQASMLASSIAAQIASGKTDLVLENFGNSSNGSFSSVKGPDGSSNYQSGDDKFTMQITGMDSAVCKQMQGMKGGTVRSVSCGTPDANGKVTATLTYNKDLSTGPVASDYNDDTTGEKCAGAGYKWCDGKCKTDCCDGKCTTGQTCVSGVCMNAECEDKYCECSTPGKVSSECRVDKPYCAYGPYLSPECTDSSSYEIEGEVWCMGSDSYCENLGFKYCVCDRCVSSAEGVCWNSPSECYDTDAPYPVGNKCSKDPEGAYCEGEEYCKSIGLKYCHNSRCYSTAVGLKCSYSYECAGTDAPYCDSRTGTCTAEIKEGAQCFWEGSQNDVCGGLFYCVGMECVSSADGRSIDAQAAECFGTDAPYTTESLRCSKDPQKAYYCATNDNCGSSAPYCIDGNSNGWGTCSETPA